MSPKHHHPAVAIVFLAAIWSWAGNALAQWPEKAVATHRNATLAGERHRVVVSTDIGGTDPDDFQSLVHLLVYADVLDIEGLVSSPYGPGRKEHILEVIDCYARDYPNLKTYSRRYPTPEALRAITRQGETEVAPYTGFRHATEGSEWIVNRARHDGPRPLHVLVWGGLEDLAQALHDAPDILPKLRVYYIGGPNKKWSPDACHYIAAHHPALWIIEANATYRGWFVGGGQQGEWGNKAFTTRHVKEHGALGDFFVRKLDTIKMGDTPSVAWLLQGAPDDPSQPGWGGQFVRAWDRPFNRFDRLTTKEDRIEVFGILELALPLGADAPGKAEARLVVENQSLVGYLAGDRTMRFRFCPKEAKTYTFEIRSNVPSLEGGTGGITAVHPSPERAKHLSSKFPDWWTDDPSPQFAEGPHAGAKTVSRWREAFLKDFAARMDRCGSPAAAPPAGPAARPHGRVQSLGPGGARWTDGFWAERVAVCRTRTVPGMWRVMSGADPSHYLENFRIAAGLKEGRHRGAPFNDGELYKWLEAACLVFDATGDVALRAAIDETVDTIARAQREDGYLHTQALVRARNGEPGAEPFQDRNNFELYNLGHLMTAACVHHQVAGETRLLEVARRAADFLEGAFRGVSPEAARSSVCPSHFMGLVDLHRETGEPRYLELAKTMFALRSQIAAGGDDNQDRVPFQKQTKAVGHAVRGNYLHAGAADLFMETGDRTFWQPLELVWENLTRQKMYITGGCGALYDGASPFASRDQRSITRTHQAYGHDYELPNVTAHSETCANIGNVLWNWRMFLATGEARFMDVLELALYNSVLSGVSLDGASFFYTNPLRVTDPLPTELRWPRTRAPHVSSFCCPPNLARTLAKSATYAYARSPRTLWVNLYGGSTVTTTLDGAGRVRVTQQADYPWNGRVRLVVDETEGHEFNLNVRIPEWSRNAHLAINEQPMEVNARPGSYATITRRWQPGDALELELPMEPRLIEANPLVEETLNQLAVKRGPLVYCLESADLPTGIRVGEVSLLPDIRLTAQRERDFLGGVVALSGAAEARVAGDWNGRLYREVKESASTPVNIRLVPYYAWGNRGKGEMTVWMPRAR